MILLVSSTQGKPCLILVSYALLSVERSAFACHLNLSILFLSAPVSIHRLNDIKRLLFIKQYDNLMFLL